MSDGNIIFIDIDIHSDDKRKKDKLRKFVENYKKNHDKLCQHKTNPGLYVPDSIKGYKEYENGKIYYLFDKSKTEIVAFAVTSTNKKNITTLNWLCSSNNIDKEKTRMDGKRLGIYLLDYVYNKYVKEKNGILKIQPAGAGLIPYYTRWNEPSLPCNLYGIKVGVVPSLPDTIFNTEQYLVYLNKDLDLKEDQINDCVYDLLNFQHLCRNLKLQSYNVSSRYKTTEQVKSYLKTVIYKLDDPDDREMLEYELDTFNYCTIFQVQKELQKIYLEKIDKKITPKRERSVVLRTIDIDKDRENDYKELKEFFGNFKIYYFSGKLCVDPSEPDSEPASFIPTTLSQYKDYTKIHYLFDENNEEIVAFALIDQDDPDDKITELSYLCSSVNIDKTISKMEGKPFGIYLLDLAYQKYVEENRGILKIEPANEKLVDYYSKWKKPSLPSVVQDKEVGIIESKPDIIFDAGNYMVYFNKDIKLSDRQIQRLIYSLYEFESIWDGLNLNPDDVLEIDKEKRREFLHEADTDHFYSDMIDNIKYYTLDDIKEALEELYKINKLSGGVYKYRKTKKTKKNKRRTQKRKSTKT